jgi:hypothetical protein
MERHLVHSPLNLLEHQFHSEVIDSHKLKIAKIESRIQEVEFRVVVGGMIKESEIELCSKQKSYKSMSLQADPREESLGCTKMLIRVS